MLRDEAFSFKMYMCLPAVATLNQAMIYALNLYVSSKNLETMCATQYPKLT